MLFLSQLLCHMLIDCIESMCANRRCEPCHHAVDATQNMAVLEWRDPCRDDRRRHVWRILPGDSSHFGEGRCCCINCSSHRSQRRCVLNPAVVISDCDTILDMERFRSRTMDTVTNSYISFDGKLNERERGHLRIARSPLEPSSCTTITTAHMAASAVPRPYRGCRKRLWDL